MEIIEQLKLEISNLDIGNFVIIFLLFYVPFNFSKKAQSQFFRLFFSSVGIYLLITMEDYRVLYDVKMLVVLGLLLPQLRFIFYFIKDVFFTIKMMSSNTYYFFITIIYKVIRFFNWIKSVFSNIAILFSNRSYQKENFYEKKQEQYSHSKKEENYQDYSSNDNSSSYENSYKEKYKEETKEESTFKHKEETQTYNGDERFYNSSAYIVLGVSSRDDFKSIKKAYRTLVRIYHPDLNPDDLKRATEITQLLNSAYAKLEKYHNN